MITAKRDGRLVYHWPASIEQLKKARGDKSADGRTKYRQLLYQAGRAAGAWQLCAVGSLCDAIPRAAGVILEPMFEMHTDEGVISHRSPPQDPILAKLGVEFCGHIGREEYDDATKTLNAIEQRAGEILKDLGKRPKKYGKPLKPFAAKAN